MEEHVVEEAGGELSSSDKFGERGDMYGYNI
jgi:hypothetical protein